MIALEDQAFFCCLCLCHIPADNHSPQRITILVNDGSIAVATNPSLLRISFLKDVLLGSRLAGECKIRRPLFGGKDFPILSISLEIEFERL
ncbi:hypothetical protein SDC9_155812 [bioreactor metagenome]|uniref:Uncharacterized protein n=1 Tax=bioreactor metagenome TaxID=1076179 RepID=A0A645F525_9ZZZZ